MTEQIVFPDSTPESQHPVLTNLKNQIDELEIAKNNLLNSLTKERNERFAYVARVKNVLVEVAKNYDGDKETIVNIANNLDIEPVSYTHLRAHETRHDLVCRLLLEKKKFF